AVHRRRAAEVPARRADLAGPDDLARVALQGDDVGVVALVAEGVDPLAGDADGGVAASQPRGLPGERRPVLRPRLEQAGRAGDGVPLGAAELWPVRGAAGRGEEGEGQGGEE